MELKKPLAAGQSAQLLLEGSEEAILQALKERIKQHRVDPKKYRMSQHAVDQDPATRSVFRSARKIDGHGRDWWTKWLIRAGMTRSEAERASRGQIYTRESVRLEIEALYRQAVRTRTWPTQEISMSSVLQARAKRAFGSVESARKAALRKLGLKRPRSPRRLEEATPAEEALVRALSEGLMRLLPIDGRGANAKASLSAIAAELGLRGWRKTSFATLSVYQLIFQALEQDPELLSRLVRRAVKRAVRHRRLRDAWGWKRWYQSATKQPVWREEVEEVIGILQNAGIGIGDLGDESFLRALPRRMGWSGLSALDSAASNGPKTKGAGGSGMSGAYDMAPTPVAPPPAPN